MPEEIKLHDAEVRVNPSGHEELVKKKKGKPDEETLNELEKAASDLEILLMAENLDESVEFSGPLPIGGGAGSPEQIQYDRRHNLFNAPEGSPAGAIESPNEESNSNTSGPAHLPADGPEEQKVKMDLPANARGNKSVTTNKNNRGLDYSATKSESILSTSRILSEIDEMLNTEG